jgi:hypothetical protein
LDPSSFLELCRGRQRIYRIDRIFYVSAIRKRGKPFAKESLEGKIDLLEEGECHNSRPDPKDPDPKGPQGHSGREKCLFDAHNRREFTHLWRKL